MKFLFFDIECSNCFAGKYKMCEFGYVLTDENFKVLRKDAIPMSPGRRNHANRFDLTIYKRDPSFQWAYDFDTYFESPEFPEYYEKIRGLFMDEDTMVFGYSVDNDIRYLNYAIERYGLEKLIYDAYDVQAMMKYYSTKRESFVGLQDAFKRLCSVSEFIRLQEHLSRDDAFMSMRVFQRMCENLGLTPLEMIKACDGCKYNSQERRFAALDGTSKHSRDLNRRNRKLWEDFCLECAPSLEKESSIGKIVTVTSKLKEDGEALKKTIALIKDKVMVPFNSFTGSDYMITLDEDDAIRIKGILKYPYAGKILALKEFETLSLE